jgi:hypothetical protein
VAASRQADKPSAQAAPNRGSPKVSHARRFTMRQLWRTALWGAAAAAALFVAVLTSRSELGSQRLESAFSLSRTRHPSPAFDAQTETRRLAAAVHDLASENTQLKARLAAVEQDVNDITGSVSRQIQAVKATTTAAWPADADPAVVTTGEIASLVSPSAPAIIFGVPLPAPPATTGAQSASETSSAATELAYGVDLGSAVSIEVLRARWLGIRSAHWQLFDGLTPVVKLRQAVRSKRVELQLVVGPLTNAEAAARLCATLASYRLFCQPTSFGRQHLALQ